MYPCVRTYQVGMERGEVKQKLLSQTSRELLNAFPYWDPNSIKFGQLGLAAPFVILNVSCLTLNDKEELRKDGYNTDSTWTAYRVPPDLKINSKPSADAPFPASLFTRQCAYIFDGLIDYSLASFAWSSSFMLGNISGNPRHNSSTFRMLSFMGLGELQALYNETNVSFHGTAHKFDDVAESFTQYMRVNGHENFSEPAAGTVLHYAVCLQASWAWITLPVVLVVGIVVLFPLTVAASARQGLPIWKSSNLPLVFRGPMTDGKSTAPLLGREGPVKEDLPPDSVSAMEKEARRTLVRLDQAGGSLRLVEIPIRGGFPSV